MGWSSQLTDMYLGWVARRHMQISRLEGSVGNSPILMISGFGAYRTLITEIGLHVLEQQGDDEATSKISARVKAIEVPLGDFRPEQLKIRIEAGLSGPSPLNTIVRRYRREPSPLVRDVARGWRTGRIDDVLQGDFDLIGQQS